MVRYFLLRGKQFLRMLVWVIAASVLLGLCAAGAGTALIRQEAEGESQQKYRVALCGITDDPLLQLGITALQTFDETRHSVVLTTMQEPDAVQALEAGTLNAYVVIPEGFLTSALQGDVKTLRYVTAPGGTAVAKLFESEITAVIGQILLTAQKGSYGGYFALADNGAEGQALAVLNELCLEYIELAFLRTRLYSVQTLGPNMKRHRRRSRRPRQRRRKALRRNLYIRACRAICEAADLCCSYKLIPYRHSLG